MSRNRVAPRADLMVMFLNLGRKSYLIHKIMKVHGYFVVLHTIFTYIQYRFKKTRRSCFTEFTCPCIRLRSYNLNRSSFVVNLSSKGVLLKSIFKRQKSEEINCGAFQFDYIYLNFINT
jgi:hypothetical protein